MKTGTLCALALVSLAAGCVSPSVYGPIDPAIGPYGYRETRNADGSYTLRVVSDDSAQAYEFWDRRAQELCGGPNFQKNIFRAERPVVQTTGYATNALNPAFGATYTVDQYGSLLLEGYLRCDAAEAAATSADNSAGAPPAGAAAPPP
jgi:hypothetical protein